MNSLNSLVTKVNTYSMKNLSRNAMLMKRVAVYITRMLRVFGLVSHIGRERGEGERGRGGREGRGGRVRKKEGVGEGTQSEGATSSTTN